METTRKTKILEWVPRIEMGNLLVAISSVGLMCLGVFEIPLVIMFIAAGVFIIVGLVGKYVDEVDDDAERLIRYEEHFRNLHAGHSNKDSPDGVYCSCRCDSVPPPTPRAKGRKNRKAGNGKRSVTAKDS